MEPSNDKLIKRTKIGFVLHSEITDQAHNLFFKMSTSNAVEIFGSRVGITVYNYLTNSKDEAGDQEAPITNTGAKTLLAGNNVACAVNTPGFFYPNITDRDVRTVVLLNRRMRPF